MPIPRLHQAIAKYNFRDVALSLQAGDDIHEVSHDEHEHLQRYYDHKKSDKSPLELALTSRASNNEERSIARKIIIYLLQHGCDPNFTQGEKTSAELYLSHCLTYDHECEDRALEEIRENLAELESNPISKKEAITNTKKYITEKESNIAIMRENPILSTASYGTNHFLDNLYWLIHFNMRSEHYPHFLLLRDIALPTKNTSLIKTLAEKCLPEEKERLAELIPKLADITTLKILLESEFKPDFITVQQENIVHLLLSAETHKRFNANTMTEQRRGGASLTEPPATDKTDQFNQALLDTLPLCITAENINQDNKKGLSPLFVALKSGFISAAKILIEHDAQVVEVYDDIGLTPMHYAVFLDDLALVQLLNAKGLSLDSPSQPINIPHNNPVILAPSQTNSLNLIRGSSWAKEEETLRIYGDTILQAMAEIQSQISDSKVFSYLLENNIQRHPASLMPILRHAFSNLRHDREKFEPLILALIKQKVLPPSSLLENMSYCTHAIVAALAEQQFDFSMLDNASKSLFNYMLTNKANPEIMATLALMEQQGYLVIEPLPETPITTVTADVQDSDEEDEGPPSIPRRQNLLGSIQCQIPDYRRGYYPTQPYAPPNTPFNTLTHYLLENSLLEDPELEVDGAVWISLSLLNVAVAYQDIELCRHLCQKLPPINYWHLVPFNALMLAISLGNHEIFSHIMLTLLPQLKTIDKFKSSELQSLYFYALAQQNFKTYHLLRENFNAPDHINILLMALRKNIVLPKDILAPLLENTLSAEVIEKAYYEDIDDNPTNLSIAPEALVNFHKRFMRKLMIDDPSVLKNPSFLKSLLFHALDTDNQSLFLKLIEQQKNKFIEHFDLYKAILRRRFDAARSDPEKLLAREKIIDKLIAWCLSAFTSDDLKRIGLHSLVWQPGTIDHGSAAFSEARVVKLIQADMLSENEKGLNTFTVKVVTETAVRTGYTEIVQAIIEKDLLPTGQIFRLGMSDNINILEYAVLTYQIPLLNLLLNSQYKEALKPIHNLFALLTHHQKDAPEKAIAMFDALIAASFSLDEPLRKTPLKHAGDFNMLYNGENRMSKQSSLAHAFSGASDPTLLQHYMRSFKDLTLDEYCLYAAIQNQYPETLLEKIVARGSSLRLPTLKSILRQETMGAKAPDFKKLDWLLTYAEAHCDIPAESLFVSPQVLRPIAHHLMLATQETRQALFNLLEKHGLEDKNRRDFLGYNLYDYLRLFGASIKSDKFDPALYAEIKSYLEKNEAEFFYSDTQKKNLLGSGISPDYILGNICYKLATVFDSLDDVREFLERHRDNTSEQRIHDLCLFSLPVSQAWHKPTWARLALKHGKPLVNYLTFAPRLEEFLDRSPENFEEIEEIAKHIYYSREAENMPLANLFKQYKVTEAGFNLVLTEYLPKETDALPHISIDGKDDFEKTAEGIDYTRYCLKKLSPDDPAGFILGAATNCCQYIGSDGHDCAMHGMTSENGAFYVLYKKPKPGSPLPAVLERLTALTGDSVLAGPANPKKGLNTDKDKIIDALSNVGNDKPQKNKFKTLLKAYDTQFKIRAQREATFEDLKINLQQHLQEQVEGEIVAQAWAWLADDDSLVLDSIELKYKEEDHPQISTDFFIALAKRMVSQHPIPEVLIGKGGGTPAAFNVKFETAASPKNPRDYYAYRDSREQLLIRSGTRAAAKIQQFWRAYRDKKREAPAHSSDNISDNHSRVNTII